MGPIQTATIFAQLGIELVRAAETSRGLSAEQIETIIAERVPDQDARWALKIEAKAEATRRQDEFDRRVRGD